MSKTKTLVGTVAGILMLVTLNLAARAFDAGGDRERVQLLGIDLDERTIAAGLRGKIALLTKIRLVNLDMDLWMLRAGDDATATAALGTLRARASDALLGLNTTYRLAGLLSSSAHCNDLPMKSRLTNDNWRVYVLSLTVVRPPTPSSKCCPTARGVSGYAGIPA